MSAPVEIARGVACGLGLRPRAPGLAWFERRLREADEALALARPGYVLLCGDSHADLLAPTAPEGLRVVDAAVSGARTWQALLFLQRTRFRARARVAILSVGFNDLNGSGYLRPQARRAFRGTASRILVRLRPWTDRVVVLALPPVAPHNAPPDRPAAIPLYSEELRRLCDDHPGFAVFADPFAPLRTADFGVCTPNALFDAMHVADNAAVWRRLGPWL